ncbi:MAG: dockerin type I repeat-containing protein [Clostridia bacterium]|nr:dockerin type I repeat-containing protein [Clostridia bacterium]
MKKTISMLLAVLFALTAFGVVTLFGGVLGAGAAFYDYYEYVSFPGYNAFVPADFDLAWMNHDRITFTGLTDAYMPEGALVDKVALFEITGTDQHGQISFGTMRQRNADPENNHQGEDFHNSPNWTANDKLNGKDIFGDSGVTFAETNGFCFWVGLNGAPFTGSVKVALFSVPTKGPYYKQSEDGSTDMAGYPRGFVFSSDLKKADEDGYVYFDFKTDFKRTDWWTTDDDGEDLPKDVNCQVPQKVLAAANALEIRYTNVQTGDKLYVGDFRTYTDTRVHTDELEEMCASFEALDSEAYTEESYAVAQDVYLEAYAMLQDVTTSTQKQIDTVAHELKNAISALKPMFKANKDSVKLAGFEVWEDDDFDEMSDGGICLDTAGIDEDIYPKNREQSVIIMGNGTAGAPAYGWSYFTNAIDEDEDGEIDGAVKNPFELLEGSEPLSEADGIRFWLKWDDKVASPPDACIIGLGDTADGLYFECESTAVELPATEGYVGVAWSNFFDMNGEEDIYDYIDNIDTIHIRIEGAEGVNGVFYIADLSGFEWNVSSADFAPLYKAISDTRTYMATLSEEEWYYKSWDRVFMAIDAGEALIGQYGVTDEEVEEAVDLINKAVSRLIPIGRVANRKTMNELEGLVESAKTYWRGNVTAASYRELKIVLDEAVELLDEDASQEAAEASIAALRAAITNLVPIKAGEKVTSILSFESYSKSDLLMADGDRTQGVTYALDKSFARLPEGYNQALKMTAQENMSAQNTDEHGVMQFKAMYRDPGSNSPIPIRIGKNKENTLMGDLTGTDGICLWVGVNDMSLVQDCTFRFSVSNCTVGPLFERSTVDIPIPSTGQGWIYLPWEYFEYYDWEDNEIDLAKIYFYIIRFNGTVYEGLEVYITGIHAYKDTTADTWKTPVISNITEGQEYDVSEQDIIPEWDVGAAMLDGKFLVYGDPVPTNGEHTLVVTNGNKSATVNFTTSGKVVDATPVVTGVEDGGSYEEGVVISWDVGEATLNGVPFENGQALYGSGAYTLIVTNGDAEPVVINFSVTKAESYEFPVVAGVADGGVYTGPVTITWDVGEATLNGAAFEKGGEVSEPGQYLLEVVNGDKTTTVNFTIEQAQPPVKKGDANGDGKISVDDALTALRVAARLAEPTEALLATCDIDGNGKIEVSDALAILRVAAKLAKEESLQ